MSATSTAATPWASSRPYVVAVTLEVAEDVGVDVYTEVRDRVRQRLQVQPRGTGEADGRLQGREDVDERGGRRNRPGRA